MSGIFVSYRRTDSAYALLLYKSLTQKFGADTIFRDFENIEPGQDFVAALEAAASRCVACVVIIGKGWLDALDRLVSPDDFVRREIAWFLEKNTLVIPCFVGGSRMPAALPAALAAFGRRDGITIGDEYFDRDSEVLLARLDRALSEAPTAVAAADGTTYRQQRAMELLKRLVARLQVRAVELVQIDEVERARDELADGFDVIMQLLEWSPGDAPLDLQLGYLCKTQAQVQDAAGQRSEADRSLELALAMFNRVGQKAGDGDVAEKAGAFNGLGNVYFARGDLDAAESSYRRALELAPDYSYAWHDLLLVHLRRAEAGRVDLAQMESALERVRSTGAGLPGLGVADLARLDAAVNRWRNARGPRKANQKSATRKARKSARRRAP